MPGACFCGIQHRQPPEPRQEEEEQEEGQAPGKAVDTATTPRAAALAPRRCRDTTPAADAAEVQVDGRRGAVDVAGGSDAHAGS